MEGIARDPRSGQRGMLRAPPHWNCFGGDEGDFSILRLEPRRGMASDPPIVSGIWIPVQRDEDVADLALINR